MQQTLEVSNLEFVGDFGEIAIDSIINEDFLRDVPLIGTLVGAGKCIKNLYDAHFAKKLIAFLIPLKDTTPEERAKAISKWENNATMPDITLLPIIADTLGVTIDELFGIRRKVQEKPINCEETPMAVYDQITI